ncbi:hypothetical protein C6W88_07710 [Halomonas litopenaei]|uniref:Uncharacterized protein n=1 Tax=Halomonas litopenaei TaxID=2109328 RepID=A0ABX5IX96_9GAMM|nr:MULTISPECIES: hypothetical protein [Halomonas]PTL95217.1 hypothetical protein C6W88_07710 [Halomonas litopenaei]
MNSVNPFSVSQDVLVEGPVEAVSDEALLDALARYQQVVAWASDLIERFEATGMQDAMGEDYRHLLDIHRQAMVGQAELALRLA